MGTELSILIVSAASIGFLHTLLGPDHYLPFVMMAKARQWSTTKTLWITGISGLGHVASSVILGAIGISIGVAVTSLESIEASRGGIAAWFLIAFGLVYFVYGMRRAMKGKKHSHLHVHENGSYHKHEHAHVEDHVHVHDEQNQKKEITPWVLFVIFLLGPCEPLIPLLMYPAAKTSWHGIVLVALVFSVVTIGTMIGSVVVLLAGSRFLPKTSVMERYMHAIAGAMIFLCGASIEFLGL